jgi:hypothetical protein
MLMVLKHSLYSYYSKADVITKLSIEIAAVIITVTTSFSIMKLSVKDLLATLSINDVQHKSHSASQHNVSSAVNLNVIILSVAIFYCYAECRNAKCRYAECRYVECRVSIITNAATTANARSVAS